MTAIDVVTSIRVVTAIWVVVTVIGVVVTAIRVVTLISLKKKLSPKNLFIIIPVSPKSLTGVTIYIGGDTNFVKKKTLIDGCHSLLNALQKREPT